MTVSNSNKPVLAVEFFPRVLIGEIERTKSEYAVVCEEFRT